MTQQQQEKGYLCCYIADQAQQDGRLADFTRVPDAEAKLQYPGGEDEHERIRVDGEDD